MNAQDLILACTPPRSVPAWSAEQADLRLGGRRGQLAHDRRRAGPGGGHLGGREQGRGRGARTDRGIDLLPAGSTTWQPLTLTGPPPGGFSYVGMTTEQQGVALPADPQAGTVWFTFDGGQTWQPSSVSGS